MVIALISKSEHAKNHVAQLEKDGYEVNCLGATPKQIPEDAQVVVLRTESCAHSGSDTAFEWSRRSSSHHLIVENGISGIRRKLTELFEEHPRIRTKRAFEMIRDTRPGDSPEEVEEALREVGATQQEVEALFNKHWKRRGPKKPTGPAPWSGSFTDYPSEEEAKWVKAIPEDRMRRELQNTQEMWNATPKVVRDEVRQMYLRTLEGGRFVPQGEAASRQGWEEFFRLQGKPVRFFLYVIKALKPEDPVYSKDLEICYEHLTSKKSDRRVIEGACWLLGRELLKGRKTFQNPDPKQEPPSDTVVEPPSDIAFEPPSEKSDTVVESDGDDPNPFEALKEMETNFEDHVLELMEKVASLEKANRDLRKTVEGLRQEVTEDTIKDRRKIEELAGLCGNLNRNSDEATLLVQKQISKLNQTVEGSLAHLWEKLTELESRPRNSPSGSADAEFYRTIDELRERGAEINITFKSIDL